MKKLFALTSILCFLMFSLPVWADDQLDGDVSILEFVQCISEYEDYSTWKDAVPVFGYDLYGRNFETSIAKLYYLEKENISVGYLIVDNETGNILEFSKGVPAYDNIPIYVSREITKKMYINGMPGILQGNMYFVINSSGDMVGNPLARYSPQLQTKNCIVSAISNLMWHWSINGYSALAKNMKFAQVEDRVDELMSAEGGYANNNIPATINDYVSEKSNYSVSVDNQWSPSFTDVKNEVAIRPCLLGFAAGSPYSDKEGHMTVCVGTRSVLFSKYVKVIDGWETEVVEKAWGKYNDFMSKVVISY